MIILDGGIGRQLQRIGAPFRQPEWSALSLMEAPEFVARAHTDFIEAGADVITTNSYAVVPFHIGEESFRTRGAELLDLAGRLARDAARNAARDAPRNGVQVAAGVPPLFGSYAPGKFDTERAPAMLALFRKHLLPHADIALAETLSCVAEAEAFLNAFSDCGKAIWLSLTLEDNTPEPGNPKLRSGEGLVEALTLARDHSVDAVLFNCSQPEVMADGVTRAHGDFGGGIAIGVYANAFPPMPGDHEANTGLSPVRADLTPERYREFADQWAADGATIIGGCCGIGLEHIRELRKTTACGA
ncbi:MAG: homocysteine S-methyltransferase family protein [Rhodospirillaceae bacterium]|nr:homocysteine S-methyltransferase family protein [Rhodospirillaceae bacterium]